MSDAREDLKAYLDGELPDHEAENVRRVLDDDPALRAEAEEFSIIGAVLREEIAVPRSEGLERTLMALSGTPPIRKPKWWIWPMRVVAAGVAATIIAIPLLRQESFVTERDSGAVVASAAQATAKTAVSSSESDSGSELQSESASPPLAVESIPVDPTVSAPPSRPLMALKTEGNSLPNSTLAPPAVGGANDFARGSVPMNPLPNVAADTALRPLSPAAPAVAEASLPTSIQEVVRQFGGRLVGTGSALTVIVEAKSAAALQKALATVVGSAGTVQLTNSTTNTAQSKASDSRNFRGAGGGGGEGNQSANQAPGQAQNQTLGQANAAQRFGNNQAAGSPAMDMAPTVEELKEDLARLGAERARLLTEFYEDSKPVKEADAEIERKKREIRLAEENRARQAKPNERTIRIVLKPGSTNP